MISDKEYNNLWRLREEISKDKNWAVDVSEKDFIKGMSLINPQSYGTKIQNWIQEKLGYTKVNATESRGDIRTIINKNYVEVKVSLLTLVNSTLNMVQIRLFHKVDYYLCVAYDCKDMSNFKKYIFVLTHDQMEKECEGANAAHGTVSVNQLNENVELRKSIECVKGNPDFERWCKLYLVDSYEEADNVFK
tara:strand:+ start:66 stop:638 length:573 start_codon:yes stop_codon:yes gene_type:complete